MPGRKGEGRRGVRWGLAVALGTPKKGFWVLYWAAVPLCQQHWAGCSPWRDQLGAWGSSSSCCWDSSLWWFARKKLFRGGGLGAPTGSAEVKLGVGLGGSAGRRGRRTELQRGRGGGQGEGEKWCQHAEATHPPSDPPKHMGGSIRERLGQVLGSQHPCEASYRPQACGCQVWRALPAARAILPATSQRCLRSRAGDQAGPRREARRGEGRRGW